MHQIRPLLMPPIFVGHKDVLSFTHHMTAQLAEKFLHAAESCMRQNMNMNINHRLAI